MLRVAYHEALDDVNAELVRLLTQVSEALDSAVRSLLTGDISLAAKVIGSIDDLVALERMIDVAAVELVWKQQPVAGELRHVAAIIELNADAGRIAHFVLEIAKEGVRLASMPIHPGTEPLDRLAELVQRDLRTALEAFRGRNAGMADVVIENGDDIDERYRAAIGALQAAMRHDAQTVEAGTSMLFVLASLVRIGEHAWNIARHTKEML